MAGGKLSPRQKMINLMYLIFIAMLALQMSKEVLTAFGYLNERLTTFNVKQNDKNSAKYADLDLKAREQPEKFGDENEKAKQIKVLSLELYNHIQMIKDVILEDVPEEDRKNYEELDKTEVLDFYFYQKGKMSEHGQAYLDAIATYRDGIVSVLGNEYPEVSESIKEYFNTDDVNIGDKGVLPVMINWIEHSFVGFPAIASLTKLTVMQSDIKGAERNVLSTMLQGQLTSDVSMTNYKAIVIPDKSAFFQGENFTGRIVLGRYDESLKPESVTVNGIEITSLEGGGAVLNFPAGNVGENPIKGKFVFMENGVPVEIPIESSYAVVAKPNDAVIAADKMNVVYRGLPNPMTISVPGVADNKVTARAAGLRKISGVGKYMMTPGTGKDIRISVTATLPDGTQMTSSKLYRIKDIPKPMATVRKESGYVKMPKSSLAKTTVRVELPDFLFDLDFTIQSFKIKVPGQATITVNGNKMNAQAQAAINKARVGDVIGIFDVKSSIQGVSLNVKDASPVTIEIQ